MKIGVPKEIKIHEYRVGLVPAGVRELVDSGHQVLVQSGAGAGIGFDDSHYQSAGASISKKTEEIFGVSSGTYAAIDGNVLTRESVDLLKDGALNGVDVMLGTVADERTALDGAPGIFSARWAGPTKDFNAAMAQIERLLRERGAMQPSQRKAHFVSALCVAWPDHHLEEVEARVDGTLVWPPRGSAGFGYDPAFLPDGHSRTFGEMTSIEKHGLPPLGLGLSHRARAFVKLAEICLEPA